MVKPDPSRLRQRLRAIHAEMAVLLPTLLGRAPMLKAYLRYQPRTCGNPGCKCAKGELHPGWIAEIPGEEGRRCRSLGRAAYRRLEKPAGAYRRFRQARAEWRRLAREADAVLRELERARLMDPDRALEER